MMAHYKSALVTGALVLFLLGFNGCAHEASTREQLGDSTVEVIIEPERALVHNLRLGIFDFIDSTQIKGLGSDMAQQIYEVLLKNRFVQRVERVDKEVSSLEWALDVGRERGYDLIVVGEVDEFMYGGMSADSKASLSLRVLDARDNVTLWYVTGTVADQPQTFLDYVLFWKTSREAASPYHLSRVLIEEMILVIDAQRQFEGEKGDVRDR